MKTNFHLKPLVAALAVALGAAGCSVIPNPFSQDEHRQRVTQDMDRLFADQEPIAGSIGLYQATARAIRYNMDYRMRLMEDAASLGQLDVAKFDLLPKLTMQAGYSVRSNSPFGRGIDTAGNVAPTFSAAQTPTSQTSNSSLTWNILDFGVSYFRAKQMADQALIAEERRRKALQNVIQDVRYAWWRAWSAQQLLPQIDELETDVRLALARSKLIEKRNLMPPTQVIAFRRGLLDIEQQLIQRRQELAQARIELAGLMNLAPGVDYRLSQPGDKERQLPDLVADLDKLDTMALDHRPELREEGYKSRITEVEAKKALLSLLPGIDLSAGSFYDKNTYLLNHTWTQFGSSVSFNLIRAFSLPAQQRLQEANTKVDQARRLAMSMAVLTQLRVAAVRYKLVTEEWETLDQAAKDDHSIANHTLAAGKAGTENDLEMIRVRARELSTAIQRDLAFANAQAALGRIYNSVGMDALPIEVENNRVDALAQLLEGADQTWQQQSFAQRSRGKPAPVTLAPVVGISGSGLEAFTASMKAALNDAEIPVADRSRLTLAVSVELDKPGTSGRPATLRVRALDAQGKVVLEASQRSMLSDPVGDSQWRALGEAAGYRIVEPLRKLLERAEPPVSAKPAATLPVAAPVAVEPAVVAAPKVEVAKAEPPKPAAVVAEPAQPEPAKAAPIAAEPAKVAPIAAAPAKIEAAKTEPAKVEQVAAEPAKAEAAKPAPAKVAAEPAPAAAPQAVAPVETAVTPQAAPASQPRVFFAAFGVPTRVNAAPFVQDIRNSLSAKPLTMVDRIGSADVRVSGRLEVDPAEEGAKRGARVIWTIKDVKTGSHREQVFATEVSKPAKPGEWERVIGASVDALVAKL